MDNLDGLRKKMARHAEFARQEAVRLAARTPQQVADDGCKAQIAAAEAARYAQQREQEWLRGHDSKVSYILTRKNGSKPCRLINRRYQEMTNRFIDGFTDGTIKLEGNKSESDKVYRARLNNLICVVLETLGWTQALVDQHDYEFRESYSAIQSLLFECEREAKQRARLLKAKEAIAAGQTREQFLSTVPKKESQSDWRRAYGDAFSEAQNG